MCNKQKYLTNAVIDNKLLVTVKYFQVYTRKCSNFGVLPA